MQEFFPTLIIFERASKNLEEAHSNQLTSVFVNEPIERPGVSKRIRAFRPKIEAFCGKHSKGFYSAGVVAFFAILVSLFFSKVLVSPGKYYIPYDILEFHYPLAYQIFSGLTRGYFPLWDPYTYAGMPLAGNIQAQLFYWPTLFLLKMSDWIFHSFPYQMLEYQLISHYLLAALGAFCLARSFDLTRPGSILAGTVYTFGGFFASEMQHLGLMNGAAWVPWVFFFIRRYIDKRKLKDGVAAGFSLSMVILAGFPALLVATFLYVGIIFFVLLLQSCCCRNWNRARSLLGCSVVLLMLSFGFSAVQLLPSLEVNSYSRASEQHVNVGLGGFPSKTFVTLLVPGFFGVGTDHYWGDEDITQSYQYVGIASLYLAFLCAATVKRKDMLLVMAMSTFSLFWAFGEDSYISRLIWITMPPTIKGAIYPYVCKLFFDLGVALMAGFGLDLLQNDRLKGAEVSRLKSALRLVLIFAAGVTLVSIVFHQVARHSPPGTEMRSQFIRIYQGINVLVFLLTAYSGLTYFRLKGRLSWRMIATSIILMTLVELFAFGAGKEFNVKSDSRPSKFQADLVDGNSYPLDFLKSDSDYQKGKFMRVDTWNAARYWCMSSRLWGLESVNGDDPLLLRDYAAFRIRTSKLYVNRRFLSGPAAANSLNLLSVKYVIASSDLEGFRPPENFRLVEDQYIKVFENKSFLPRAFVTPRAIFQPDLKLTLAHIVSSGFSPREYVMTSEEKIRRFGEGNQQPEQGTAFAQIVSYLPNQIIIEVSTPYDGYLVLGEIYYPGWKATVDGQKERIFRANGIFRGLTVRAGAHHVVLTYEPLSFRLGAAISSATLLLTVLGFVFQKHFGRSKRTLANLAVESGRQPSDNAHSPIRNPFDIDDRKGK